LIENDDERSLEGRRVLITGGTTGIGRGVAMELAKGGVKLFLCGLDEHLDEALADLRKHDPEADGITCDIAKAEELDRLFAAATEHLGGLEAVVANAGVAAGGILDLQEDEWRRAVAIDFTGTLATCARAARALGSGGDVVITGSMSTHRPGKGSSIYASAKAGLHAFAECFRKEVAEQGLKVAIIEPGKTGADLFGSTYSDDDMREFAEEDRMLIAEDVGRLAAFILRQPSRAVVAGVRLEPRLHV
jgi:NAD(P)-dependent dehydrogenase (short-subunit alcohol dehydrogenase family)